MTPHGVAAVNTDDPRDLAIDRAASDGGTVLTLRGELDAASAPELQAAIASTPAGPVSLDLGGVTFVDSSGLAAIIEASLVLARSGQSLVITERSEVVSRVLELSGVDAHLGLRPS